MQFAYLMVEQNNLRRYAAPFLHRLQEQYRETVDLAMLDRSEVVYLDVLESPQRVKLAAAIGQRLPAFCTATGKSLLAYMDDETVQRVMDDGMPKHTDSTIISREALLENLRAIRAKGFAISEQEYEEGINAVAAPILDTNGYPIASIAVTGPAFRLSHSLVWEIGPAISATAKEIALSMRG